MDERFRQAEEITDNVLWTALTGNNNLLLTLKMVNIETLSKVVADNPTLNQTVFREHPSLLYSLANVHLLELNSELNLAHFILDIPLIRGADSQIIFRAAQVGMVVNREESLCTYFNLHNFCILKDGILFDHPEL